MFIVVAFSSAFEIGGVELNTLAFFIALAIGVLIILPSVLLRWWFFSRKRLTSRDITAEFAPPLGFTPAEVSYLFKRKLGDKEVVATIIHLTQRGLLHIKKHGAEKRVYAGPKVDSKLTTYEKMIVSQADVPDGVLSTALIDDYVSFGVGGSDDAGVPKSYAMTQLVRERLVQRGYVRKKPLKNYFKSTINITLLLKFSLVLLPLIVAATVNIIASGASEFSAIVDAIVFILIACVVTLVPVMGLSALLVLFRGGKSGRKWIITPKLKRFWAQVVGFRQYVQLAERDKLKFRTTQLKKKSYNDMLPYSIALDCVKNWREIIS